MNLTREILKTPITMDDFKKAYRITIDVWTVDKNGELDEVVESYHCMGDDSFSVNHMEETEFFRKDFDCSIPKLVHKFLVLNIKNPKTSC